MIDPIVKDDEFPEYEWAIMNSCKSQKEIWAGQKFCLLLREHKRKHPLFKPERVADIFISAEEKYKLHYVYRPISDFTKIIHKANSIRSQAEGER